MFHNFFVCRISKCKSVLEAILSADAHFVSLNFRLFVYLFVVFFSVVSSPSHSRSLLLFSFSVYTLFFFTDDSTVCVRASKF